MDRDVFITGFWGSSDPAWWEGGVLPGREEEMAKRWATKTLPEARKAVPMMQQLSATAYVFCEYTSEALKELPQVAMEWQPGGHWRRKLLCIADALERHRSVVWIDLDARQLQPLPPDFWPVLHARGPLQARIRQYHRRKCHHWRKENPRTLGSAAFVYCRDRDLVLQALDWLDSRSEVMNPRDAICLTEEHAIAWVIDQLQGGWRGPEAYHEHFDPPWYTIGGEIFPCETPVFTAS